ncbi:PKD domain-containing protein [bacterium]|nr:PKD domain-containing protein [bacterium]
MPKKFFSIIVVILSLCVAVPALTSCEAIASYLLWQWIEDEFGSGDDSEREQPFISQISIDREEIHVNEQVLLTCVAEDNKDSAAELDYLWVVSDGEIPDPASRVTIWLTPASPGVVSLSVIVTDSDGNQASASVDINVLL